MTANNFNWDDYETVENSPSKAIGSFNWDDYETVNETPKSNLSDLKAGLIGAGQGVTMGFGDELYGAARALGDTAFGDAKLADLGKTYSKRRDEARLLDKEARENSPISYNTGNVGGAVASAFIPGLNIAKGAGLLGMAGRGAVQGGIAGLGASEADNVSDALADARSGATLGGILGGVTGSVAPLVGKAGSKLASSAQGLAEEISTNPLISKTINSTDLSNQATGIAKKLLGNVVDQGLLDNKYADMASGAIARKLTYSTPVTGAVQGISDILRIGQKGAEITAENLPKLMPMLGKYGKVLQDASARGGNSLAATHYVLQQTEPDYREIVNKPMEDLAGTNE